MNGIPLVKPHGNQGNSNPLKWTPAQDAILTQHAVAGLLTYALISGEINAEFGTQYSRNACIGRAKRLGLLITNPRVNSSASIRKPPGERIRKSAAPKVKTPAPISLRCVEIEPLNISLFELTDHTCKWPYGDNSPFSFCGHPTFERSYCVHHFYRSIGPGTTSERMAERMLR